MRLKNYIINEEINTPSKEIRYIKKNCKPFLKESGGKIFFRGSSNDYGEFAIKRPRKDRQPKDMSPILTKMLDERFKKTIGWKPRSQGVFTTPDLTKAPAFGNNIYVFYPVGQFKFLFFRNIDDTLTIQHSFFHKLLKYPTFQSIDANSWFRFRDLFIKNQIQVTPELKEIFQKALDELMKEKEYKPVTSNLNQVNQEEVTFFCKKYLLIDHSIFRKYMKNKI